MEPAGLLMETAFQPCRDEILQMSEEDVFKTLKAGQEMYSKSGITTAQEGATSASEVETLKKAAAQGLLYLDIVAYPLILDLQRVLENNPVSSFGVYSNHFKLGGVKCVADGSPQGRTAYFTKPYLTPGPEGQKDWCGEPRIRRSGIELESAEIEFEDNMALPATSIPIRKTMTLRSLHECAKCQLCKAEWSIRRSASQDSYSRLTLIIVREITRDDIPRCEQH